MHFCPRERGRGKTVLLDKRDVCTGSTAASTTLLQYEIDTEFLLGLTDMFWQSGVCAPTGSVEAIDRVEELVKNSGDDSRWV